MAIYLESLQPQGNGQFQPPSSPPPAPTQPGGADVGLGQEFVSGLTGAVESGIGDFALGAGYVTGSDTLTKYGEGLLDSADHLPTKGIDVTNINSWDDMVHWSAHSAGTFLGSAAALVGGGGGAGLAVRGAAKVAARKAGKELSESAAKKAFVGGALAGDFTTHIGGSVHAGGDGIVPIITAAVGKTALDVVGFGHVANKLGLTSKFTGEFSKHLAKHPFMQKTAEFGGIAALAGGANGLQTAIDESLRAAAASGDYTAFDQGAVARIVDSVAQGAFGVGLARGAAGVYSSHRAALDLLKKPIEQTVADNLSTNKDTLQELHDIGLIDKPNSGAVVDLITEAISNPVEMKKRDPHRYQFAIAAIESSNETRRAPEVVQKDIRAGKWEQRFSGLVDYTKEGFGQPKLQLTKQEALDTLEGMDPLDKQALVELPDDAIIYKAVNLAQGVPQMDKLVSQPESIRNNVMEFKNSPDVQVQLPNVIYDKLSNAHAQSLASRKATDFLLTHGHSLESLAAALGYDAITEAELKQTPGYIKLMSLATFAETHNAGQYAQYTPSHEGTRIDPNASSVDVGGTLIQPWLRKPLRPGLSSTSASLRNNLPKGKGLSKRVSIPDDWMEYMHNTWEKLGLPEVELQAYVRSWLGEGIEGEAMIGALRSGSAGIMRLRRGATLDTFLHEFSHLVTFSALYNMPKHIFNSFWSQYEAQSKVLNPKLQAPTAHDISLTGIPENDISQAEHAAKYAVANYAEFTRNLVQLMLDKFEETGQLQSSTTDGVPISNAARRTVKAMGQLRARLGLSGKENRAFRQMEKLLTASMKGDLSKYVGKLGKIREKLHKQGFTAVQAGRLMAELMGSGGQIRKSDLANGKWFAKYPALRELVNSSPILKGRSNLDPLTLVSLLSDGTQPLEMSRSKEHVDAVYVGDMRVAEIHLEPNGAYTIKNLVDKAYYDDVVRKLQRHEFTIGERTITIDGKEMETLQFNFRPDFTMSTKAFRDDLTKYNRFLKIGVGLLQWVKLNPHLTPLVDYANTVSQKIMPYKAKMYEETLGTLQTVRTLPKQQQEGLWNLLLNESSDKAYGIVEGVFTTDEDGNEIPVTLDTLTEKQLREASKDKGGLTISHGIGERTFFNYDTLLAYQEVRGQLSRGLKEVYTEFINKAETPELRQQLQDEFNAFSQHPYFPFMRFGKHILLVNHKATGQRASVEFFEKPREMRARQEELKHSPQLVVHKSYKMDDSTPFAMLPPGLMGQVAEKLNVSESQRAILRELSAEFSPDRSYRNFLRKRRGVKGFSKDGQRSFAAYMMSSSNFYTRIKYGSELQSAVKDLRDTASQVGKAVDRPRDVSKYFGMAEWMTEHMSEMFSPESNMIYLRSFGTVMLLGANLKSALVNLTQVPMFGFPVLASRIGTKAASAEITKAYASVRKIEEDPVLLKYFDQAVKDGIVDESLFSELAGLSSTSNLERSIGGQAAESWWKTSQVLMAPFHKVELINRQVMFQATFNGFRKKGLHPEEAYREAIDMIRATQFEYAHWNKAKFMWGKMGTFFMFWTWTQNALALLGGVHGKAEARAALMGLIAFGGIMAVPGTEDAMKLLSFMLNKIGGGKYNDIQVSAEQAVKEIMGGSAGDVLMHGIAAHGFGLPAIFGEGADFNVSGSLGMGRLVPGLQESLATGTSFNSTTGSIASSASGAAFGVPLAMIRGITDDDPWSMANVLPKFLANPVQAYRYAKADGVVLRDRSVLKVAPYGAMKTAFHAAGLIPADVQEVKRRHWREKEIMKYYQTRRSGLLGQFWRARVEDDREALADARKAIRQYNASVKGTPMAISNKDLMRSIRSRLTKKNKTEAGIAPTRYAAEIKAILGNPE